MKQRRALPAGSPSTSRWFYPSVLATALVLHAACVPVVAHKPPAAAAIAAAPPGPIAGPDDAGPVPIDDESPAWGDATAPVTIVEFSDLQCPFCARVQPTLGELEERYGPHQLRVVFKHDPLSFHENAHAAALAAEAVRQLGGNERFFQYIAMLYRDQAHLGPDDLRRDAAALGIDSASFALLSRSPGVSARVDADIELAARVGANGTPHFLVNGSPVSGAVPVEAFVAVVDRELAAARDLISHGTPAARVYAIRSRENFQKPEPPPTSEAPEAPEETAFAVPLGSSPRQGPDDALVTIIEFSDFECPFCKRVQPTLEAVRKRYGNDVRFVWKHLPLPFHRHARAAATLSIEARRALGDAGFWKAAGLLFDASPNLEPTDLQDIARELHVDWTKVSRAIASDADEPVISEDEATAIDFEARGTPNFFINGRHLVGAQPLDAFTELIDAELEKAKKLVASGVPRARVFDELMRSATAAPAPEQKSVPEPTAANPSRGPATAPVTIQMFADFECPYCRRAMKTMEELEKRHPNQIRLVYRNMPLDFHAGARIGAAAALEAYAQRGSAAFWKMAALLEADQDDPAPLTRDDVVEHAKSIGLDVNRFEHALDEGRHDAAIDDDVHIALSAGIQGTPSFVINGYYLAGAQPLAIFERAVQRALAARGRGSAVLAK